MMRGDPRSLMISRKLPLRSETTATTGSSPLARAHGVTFRTGQAGAESRCGLAGPHMPAATIADADIAGGMGFSFVMIRIG